MTEKKRPHDIVKMFKKYGTQSAIRTFKNNQLKHWGFTLEINKYKDKDGSMRVCGEGASCSSHNIEGFLEKRVKNIMCRNGNFDFLIKHHNSTLSAGSVLTSDVQGSVQKAINRGCPVEEVVARLETLKKLVAGEFIKIMTTIDAGEESASQLVGVGQSATMATTTASESYMNEQFKHDLSNLAVTQKDLEEARALLDVNNVMQGMEVEDEWADGVASPIFDHDQRKAPPQFGNPAPIPPPAELFPEPRASPPPEPGHAIPPPSTAPAIPPPTTTDAGSAHPPAQTGAPSNAQSETIVSPQAPSKNTTSDPTTPIRGDGASQRGRVTPQRLAKTKHGSGSGLITTQNRTSSF